MNLLGLSSEMENRSPINSPRSILLICHFHLYLASFWAILSVISQESLYLSLLPLTLFVRDTALGNRDVPPISLIESVCSQDIVLLPSFTVTCYYILCHIVLYYITTDCLRYCSALSDDTAHLLDDVCDIEICQIIFSPTFISKCYTYQTRLGEVRSDLTSSLVVSRTVPLCFIY